jgi:predicted site-specific integrase-resolvase
VKLSQWAKEQGLTYKGAWRMWKAGQLPVPAEQLPTGTIIVKEIKAPADAVGLYARVSSSEQRKDLQAP